MYGTDALCEAKPLQGGDHVLYEVVPHGEVDLEVPHHQLQDVHQLGHRVPVLHDYLLRPVGQHSLHMESGKMHAKWEDWLLCVHHILVTKCRNSYFYTHMIQLYI